MNTRTDTAGPTRISAWDRAAILALGGAGCALSYDALQQMAEAIHVRGPLTYLFPLVIDGFIAYGVRALVVLRTAPFWSRLYVWALFGTATAASIWANALHAVRLNQQHQPGTGLRLGDDTVGLLSTLAPLALAGAVHLYILIARRTALVDRRPGAALERLGDRNTTDHITDHTADRAEIATAPATPTRASLAHHRLSTEPRRTGSTHPQPHRKSDTDRRSTTAISPARPQPTGTGPVLDEPPEQGRHDDDRASRETSPRLPGDQDELLRLARQAVTESGRVTRGVVADGIRGQGLPLANARLTALMRQLRNEDRQPTGTPSA